MPANVGPAARGGWLAEKLSRVTSSERLIPEIDGLRFVAIAGVIAFHMISVYLPASGRSGRLENPEQWLFAARQSWLLIPVYCGHFGVHLFFVLSGFILALPFARRAFSGRPPPGLRSYYLRRVTRIEPPYVLSLVLCFVWLWHRRGGAAGLWPHLFASSLYAHGLAYGESSIINGVTWSLEVEIQFYLLVPALVRIMTVRSSTARRSLMIAAIIGLGLLSQFYVDVAAHPRLRRTLVNFLHYFLAGFLLTDVYLTHDAQAEPRSLQWDLVTVASGAAIMAILCRFSQCAFLLPFLALSLCWSCFRGRVSNALITYRWTVIVGGMCYSLYLYHAVVISDLVPRTIAWSSTSRPLGFDVMVQCLLVLPLVFVLSGVLFVFVEKPCMEWSRSRARDVGRAVARDERQSANERTTSRRDLNERPDR
jgi:peptidoglycan/LPS O-acetylase OafA/YrhL